MKRTCEERAKGEHSGAQEGEVRGHVCALMRRAGQGQGAAWGTHLIVNYLTHEGGVVGPFAVQAPVAHEGAVNAGARDVHQPVLLEKGSREVERV